MAFSNFFKSDPLKGKSNYVEWINKAKLYLQINGFMLYINGSELPPNKSLYIDDKGKPISPEYAIKYNDRLSEYQRNEDKALGAINSIISEELAERFSGKSTAKELWDTINYAFGESSISVVGRYLTKLWESNYASSEGIDDYTNTI